MCHFCRQAGLAARRVRLAIVVIVRAVQLGPPLDVGPPLQVGSPFQVVSPFEVG